MPNLAAKNYCSGCTACYSVCPKSAIVMRADTEGFVYPTVDAAKCVECKLCEKACPSLNREQPREPIVVYAAQAKDDDLRMKSSSGGVFSLLARKVIEHGGIVFGAGFDLRDWHVQHKPASNEEELGELRGSKYVQSEIGDTFAAVRRELEKSRKTMFVGTPCQVAGLRKYLLLSLPPALQDNLLLVDVVCHAVPSQLAWRKYLDGKVAKYGHGTYINHISFRKKDFGWKRYALALDFANGKGYRGPLGEDSFLNGFLAELFSRPSCHCCSCRELRSGSDLTLGDYWRVGDRFTSMDDDIGTSLLIVNTRRGEALLELISEELEMSKSTFEDAKVVNPSIVKSKMPNEKRDWFFSALQKLEFDVAVERAIRVPLRKRVCAKLKHLIASSGGRK